MQKYQVSPYQTMFAGGILNLNGRSVSTVNREDLKQNPVFIVRDASENGFAFKSKERIFYNLVFEGENVEHLVSYGNI